MPRFIKNNQFIKLRKAMQDGDERAKAILLAQVNDDGDPAEFDRLLSEYFAPTETPSEPQPSATTPDMEVSGMSNDISTGNKLLDKFLRDNKVSRDDSDYQEYVDSFFEMFPEAKEVKVEEETGPAPELIAEDELFDPEDLKLDNNSESGSELPPTIEEAKEDANVLPSEPEPEEPKNTTFEDLIQDELEAIQSYDTFLQHFAVECDDPDELLLVKTTINKIRDDEFKHIEDLKALKCKMCKEENELTIEEIQ